MSVASETSAAIEELVAANHILALENVLDAYGHVSLRNPNDPSRFFLSCSRSPELVTEEDIMEFGLDGEAVGDDKRSPYLERFIHSAILEANPEVNAVVHSHAEEVLPFTVTQIPLRPVFHTASVMGAEASVWDIHDEFGDTDLLVTNRDQGRSLAKRFGKNRVVLMRGHGFAAVGTTLYNAVSVSVNVPKNARVVMNAVRLGGEIRYVSEGEIKQRVRAETPRPGHTPRAWEYWKARAAAASRK